MGGETTGNEGRTIRQYMEGASPVALSNETVLNILSERGIDLDTPLADVTKKDKLLLKADVLAACATSPTTSRSVEDADGTWKHKESGGEVSDKDKRLWLSIANSIYDQFGELRVGTPSLRINAYGMRIWRRNNG
nr:MAG TPA: hypothetical protein [Caudoviricetes sp.]